ncbi:hypothetical protein BJ508DRAFT_178889 [Ascobolus immersus RN42]|uniref:Uncharacterized protein n=1 Tax=Ascobolus immersus RN42 TaxID=1160509 RepID=A0A3N4IHI0_ASCIM|nr:hypothetical protein BJ508DRAFT_178889 [Ascobolus immersus RN42]
MSEPPKRPRSDSSRQTRQRANKAARSGPNPITSQDVPNAPHIGPLIGPASARSLLPLQAQTAPASSLSDIPTGLHRSSIVQQPHFNALPVHLHQQPHLDPALSQLVQQPAVLPDVVGLLAGGYPGHFSEGPPASGALSVDGLNQQIDVITQAIHEQKGDKSRRSARAGKKERGKEEVKIPVTEVEPREPQAESKQKKRRAPRRVTKEDRAVTGNERPKKDTEVRKRAEQAKERIKEMDMSPKAKSRAEAMKRVRQAKERLKEMEMLSSFKWQKGVYSWPKSEIDTVGEEGRSASIFLVHTSGTGRTFPITAFASSEFQRHDEPPPPDDKVDLSDIVSPSFKEFLHAAYFDLLKSIFRNPEISEQDVIFQGQRALRLSGTALKGRLPGVILFGATYDAGSDSGIFSIFRHFFKLDGNTFDGWVQRDQAATLLRMPNARSFDIDLLAKETTASSRLENSSAVTQQSPFLTQLFVHIICVLYESYPTARLITMDASALWRICGDIIERELSLPRSVISVHLSSQDAEAYSSPVLSQQPEPESASGFADFKTIENSDGSFTIKLPVQRHPAPLLIDINAPNRDVYIAIVESLLNDAKLDPCNRWLNAATVVSITTNPETSDEFFGDPVCLHPTLPPKGSRHICRICGTVDSCSTRAFGSRRRLPNPSQDSYGLECRACQPPYYQSTGRATKPGSYGRLLKELVLSCRTRKKSVYSTYKAGYRDEPFDFARHIELGDMIQELDRPGMDERLCASRNIYLMLYEGTISPDDEVPLWDKTLHKERVDAFGLSLDNVWPIREQDGALRFHDLAGCVFTATWVNFVKTVYSPFGFRYSLDLFTTLTGGSVSVADIDYEKIRQVSQLEAAIHRNLKPRFEHCTSVNTSINKVYEKLRQTLQDNFELDPSLLSMLDPVEETMEADICRDFPPRGSQWKLFYSKMDPPAYYPSQGEGRALLPFNLLDPESPDLKLLKLAVERYCEAHNGLQLQTTNDEFAMYHCFFYEDLIWPDFVRFLEMKMVICFWNCNKPYRTYSLLDFAAVYLVVCFTTTKSKGSHLLPLLFDIHLCSPFSLTLAHGVHGREMTTGWSESPLQGLRDGLGLEAAVERLLGAWNPQLCNVFPEHQFLNYLRFRWTRPTMDKILHQLYSNLGITRTSENGTLRSVFLGENLYHDEEEDEDEEGGLGEDE